MRLVAEYLKHAEFCRTLADMAQPQDKKILEELADKWERVAAIREQDLMKRKTALAPDGPFCEPKLTNVPPLPAAWSIGDLAPICRACRVCKEYRVGPPEFVAKATASPYDRNKG